MFAGRLIGEVKKGFKTNAPAPNPDDISRFRTNFVEADIVEQLSIPLRGFDQRKSMLAYKHTLITHKTKKRHAFVRVLKNSEDAGSVLLETMAQFNALGAAFAAKTMQMNLDFFVMDYLGRASNQHNDTFDAYTPEQDANSLKDFFTFLLDQRNGYDPENVTVVADCYGAAILLWSLYVIQNTDPVLAQACQKMSIILTRAFDNPLLGSNPLLLLIPDKDAATDILRKHGWLPPLPFRDMADKFANLIAFHGVGDSEVEDSISLVRSLERDPNKRLCMWDVIAPAGTNVHYASYDQLRLSVFRGLTVFQMIIATICKKPIAFDPSIKLPPDIPTEFKLKENPPRNTYPYVIQLPPPLLNQTGLAARFATEVYSFRLDENLFTAIINDTLPFCMQQEKLALTKGANHKSSFLGSKGATVQEKMKVAVQILDCISNDVGLALKIYADLCADEGGPHLHADGSNTLREIFAKLRPVMKLLNFNFSICQHSLDFALSPASASTSPVR